MPFLSSTATLLIALLHIYILTLEMFLWTTPRGLKAFNLTPEFAQKTKPLAANQGLYNGFLAAGLIWALLHPVAEFARQIAIFNLGCVVVAGAFGGFTANPRIFVVQCFPAVVALSIVLAGL
ncbi:MAG: hypothetical protein GOMPHAMPRED_006484 [Gomphillus americanus]|uniref:DUF1304 domain-containing protein n=1 Tax=Gomphillus americanus TaxID=1940652 RepID=A0A8H3FZZ9_9LECA|nr:MAG: hypothetical protein GOMPHAMPRED_006484 [Gomphillus americanus]